MPSQIFSAMANMEAALRGNAGLSGTLRRGADSTTGVVAVIDTVSYETVDDAPAAVMTMVLCDLLIKPGDYQISSVQVDPSRGDTWSYTDDFGVAREYTAMFPSTGAVFAVEPHGHLMRVHTKET